MMPALHRADRFDDLLAGLIDRGVRNPVVRIETAAGEIVFEGAAGPARPDGAAPMTPATAFHLASVTKTLTATLLLGLIEEGWLGPDGLDATLDDLDVFAPEILDRLCCRDGTPQGRRITLRQLLTHTSGLLDVLEDDPTTLGGPAPGSLGAALMHHGGAASRFWLPWDPARPDDAEAGVVNFLLNRGHAGAALWAPGEALHYSDTGYVILGLVTEWLAEMPLHQAWRERVFGPLGMTRTYLAYREDPPALGPGRRPEAEIWYGDRPLLSTGIDLSVDWAGGGLVSTTADLARFMRALLDGRLFRSAATLAAMTDWATPRGLELPRTGVGLGLWRTQVDGIELWGHTGAWGARMVVEPRSGLLLTGTINQRNGPHDWHGAFMRQALNEIGA